MNGPDSMSRPDSPPSGSAPSGSAPVDERGPRIVRVAEARGFLGRARGLLFRPPLPDGVGLLFEQTRCVHGFGLDRSLDLAFIDSSAIVRRLCALAPMRWRHCLGAQAVVEFEAGGIVRLGLRDGDRLRLLRGAFLATAMTGLLCVTLALGVMVSGAALLPRDVQAQMNGVFSAGWVARFVARAESLYQSGEDGAAIQAWETVARMDSARIAQSVLRIGNVHQRNGREWEAMRQYSRLLSQPQGYDAVSIDARRKALLNLHELHGAMADQAARALDAPANAAAGDGLVAHALHALHALPAAPASPAARDLPLPPIATRPSTLRASPHQVPQAAAPIESPRAIQRSAEALTRSSGQGGASTLPSKSGLPRVEYLRATAPTGVESRLESQRVVRRAGRAR